MLPSHCTKSRKVIAIDHRDCGAAKIAYGDKSIADPATETATHKRVLTASARRSVAGTPTLRL